MEKLLEAHVFQSLPEVDEVCPGLPEALSTFITGALAKKPADRLTDWELVLHLLDPEPGALDLGDEPQAERLIRLRYPESAEGTVQGICASMEAELGAVDGVDVAWARIGGAGED